MTSLVCQEQWCKTGLDLIFVFFPSVPNKHSDQCYEFSCRALHRCSVIISFVNHLASSFRLIIFPAIYRLQLPNGKPENMGTVEKKQSFLSACRLQLNVLTDPETEVVIPLKQFPCQTRGCGNTTIITTPKYSCQRGVFKLLHFCYCIFPYILCVNLHLRTIFTDLKRIIQRRSN